MADVPQHRSQVILRMPVDYVDVRLVMHDGEVVDAICFVPPGETISEYLVASELFMPVMCAARIKLIARSALACATLKAATPDEDALPVQTQKAAVKLRSGVRLEGELRVPAVDGRLRTADYANSDEPHLVLHAGGETHHIAKAHVATIEELDS
jgi:hypothetical protein